MTKQTIIATLTDSLNDLDKTISNMTSVLSGCNFVLCHEPTGRLMHRNGLGANVGPARSDLCGVAHFPIKRAVEVARKWNAVGPEDCKVTPVNALAYTMQKRADLAAAIAAIP
jgi:hypothetical protein